MNNKDLDDFVTGYVIADIVDEATSDDGNERSSSASFLFWGFVAFILFCIYAISGFKLSTIWSFFKIVSFPVTWDYQLLDFKILGTNNYYSFVGSILVAISMFYILKGLQWFVYGQLQGKVLKKTIGRFPPVQTIINLVSVLFEILLSLSTVYFYALIIKVMAHGFLSIFTFLFSL
jgi:hypothetical protein